jgi:hypothetical protein
MKLNILPMGATLTVLACLNVPAIAQDRPESRGREPGGLPAPLHLDQRYHHDH